jgi:hypothetical protein
MCTMLVTVLAAVWKHTNNTVAIILQESERWDHGTHHCLATCIEAHEADWYGL